MRQKRATDMIGGEKTIRDIRRATRRQYSGEENIRIVLDGLRGEDNIAELCRREGINQNFYYGWSRLSRSMSQSPPQRTQCLIRPAAFGSTKPAKW